MSILMPKRSHVQCPRVLSEDLRGGSLWGLQEAAQKSKPQIHQERSNGKPSLHLSHLPIVTLLSGTEALIPPGSEPPLLPVCTSPICPSPLAPTSRLPTSILPHVSAWTNSCSSDTPTASFLFSQNKWLKSLLMFHKANNPGEDWMGDTWRNIKYIPEQPR